MLSVESARRARGTAPGSETLTARTVSTRISSHATSCSLLVSHLINACDSGSSMTVFTRAELSRYQTSALIGSEPFEHLARPLRPFPQRQRRAEFAQMPGASAYPSRSHKPLEPFLI